MTRIHFRCGGIRLKAIVGESTSISKKMIEPWNETTPPTLLSNYKLEDIDHADEFDLFYQCLPGGKTYLFSGKKCSGDKNGKIRLAGMATAN